MLSHAQTVRAGSAAEPVEGQSESESESKSERRRRCGDGRPASGSINP